MNFFHKPLSFLSDILYPASCVHCDLAIASEEGLFCTHCKTNILPLSQPSCFVCQTPFVSDAATSHSPSHRCGDCQKNPPPFSKAITPFLYEGPMASAICKFKYEKKPHLAKPLTQMICDHLAHLNVNCVMAVPLFPSRLRSREFNQSLLLAREIGRAISRPFLIDAMVRTRETLPQVGLSKKEREENIKAAFRVIRKDAVTDQKILLVDDVYTTGATLKEGAKMLMASGAKEVVVATLSRMRRAEGTGTAS
jgi:ComF family protein